MTTETPKLRPYHDAPRLPDGETLDIASLVRGQHYELEVGPGRGGFSFERLAAAPEAALLGFEVRRKWATIVDNRLAAHGLRPRARVFAEDAKLALPRLGPDGSFARAFMHFPDPWWKKRHTKRLVMGDVFLAQVHRLLAEGGELFVQTDVEDRAHEYRNQVDAFRLGDDEQAALGFEPFGDQADSPWLEENPYGARSPREHRAVADGLPVWRMRWKKRAAR